MRLGIVRLYTGESGKVGYYNLQEVGLAKELVATLDIEVVIFILRNKKKYPKNEIIDIDKNIKIIYLPVNALGNHGILNPNRLNMFNLDLIQLNSDNQISCSRIIKWALKKEIPIYTYIGTISSDSNNLIKSAISKLIVKNNCKMMKKITNVAKTPSVLSSLKNLGIQNTITIPVGLDLGTFKEIKEFKPRQILLNKYGIPINKKILLFVGRLEEYKKPLETLKILKYIKEKENDYHLLIVGSGSLKNKLLEKSKILKLENDITYIEKIENKYISEIYKLSDILINTNDKEIYGMSILESMYCGCPVIAKQAPGPSYIISNGETGYLVDNYDENIWYENILKIIQNREEFSKNSIERIKENFTWNVICTEYEKLFEKLNV